MSNKLLFMGDVNHEPSMEEILASIKRIIAEDGEAAVQAADKRRGRGRGTKPTFEVQDETIVDVVEDIAAAEEPVVPPPSEEVLELTEKLDIAAEVAGEEPSEPVSPLVSPAAATASRSALSALSALIVKPAPLADNTLEGLVREMLRPMLKEWLDVRLPELVEEMVAKEIARITGKTF